MGLTLSNVVAFIAVSASMRSQPSEIREEFVFSIFARNNEWEAVVNISIIIL